MYDFMSKLIFWGKDFTIAEYEASKFCFGWFNLVYIFLVNMYFISGYDSQREQSSLQILMMC